MTDRRVLALNSDTGFLKMIAILSMVCDHAGKMFFPKLSILRLIGRLAFPIFCYCLTVGSLRTRDPRRYLARILAIALISQPIYCLALAHVTARMREISFGAQPVQSALMWYILSLENLNIMFSLFLGLLMIVCIREKKYILLAAATFLAWRFSAQINYGWRGIALMLLFYAFCDRRAASFVWVFGFMAWWGITTGNAYRIGPVAFALQGFAVLALPAIYVPTNTGIKPNKWFFYLFYPGHLAVIYAISCLMR